VAIAVVVLAAGILVPCTIHVGGSFVAMTPTYVALTAPGQGVVARVFVTEGAVVPAGAPLALVRDVEDDRQEIVLARQVDSLAARVARARAAHDEGDAQGLGAQQAELAAALGALHDRAGGLDFRAPVAGMVVTPRVEEATGRHVMRGDTVVQLVGTGDSLELRVMLDAAGATEVRPGQRASVISLSDLAVPVAARVATVATAGTLASGATPSPAMLEARIRVPASASWRSGVTGRASIAIRRTNLFGAFWWNVRKRVRSDFLM
jgi:biotin carboxyl carrier protein